MTLKFLMLMLKNGEYLEEEALELIENSFNKNELKMINDFVNDPYYKNEDLADDLELSENEASEICKKLGLNREERKIKKPRTN